MTNEAYTYAVQRHARPKPHNDFHLPNGEPRRQRIQAKRGDGPRSQQPLAQVHEGRQHAGATDDHFRLRPILRKKCGDYFFKILILRKKCGDYFFAIPILRKNA